MEGEVLHHKVLQLVCEVKIDEVRAIGAEEEAKHDW